MATGERRVNMIALEEVRTLVSATDRAIKPLASVCVTLTGVGTAPVTSALQGGTATTVQWSSKLQTTELLLHLPTDSSFHLTELDIAFLVKVNTLSWKCRR